MTPLVCSVLEWDKGPFLCISLFPTSKQLSGSQRPLFKAAASWTDSLNSSLGPRAARRAGPSSPQRPCFSPKGSLGSFQRRRFSGYSPLLPRHQHKWARGNPGCPSLSSPLQSGCLNQAFPHLVPSRCLGRQLPCWLGMIGLVNQLSASSVKLAQEVIKVKPFHSRLKQASRFKTLGLCGHRGKHGSS